MLLNKNNKYLINRIGLQFYISWLRICKTSLLFYIFNIHVYYLNFLTTLKSLIKNYIVFSIVPNLHNTSNPIDPLSLCQSVYKFSPMFTNIETVHVIYK